MAPLAEHVHKPRSLDCTMSMAKSSLTRSPVPKRVAMSIWFLNPSVDAHKGTTSFIAFRLLYFTLSDEKGSLRKFRWQ